MRRGQRGGEVRVAVERGDDGLRHSAWSASTPDYRTYHDTEWGRAVTDDTRLYEKLCLEGFQSGLSWLIILRKHDAFRRAFRGFDPHKVARFGEADIRRLLNDAGIVRHRGKIEATIANARGTIAVQEACGSLAALVWSYEPARRGRPVPVRLDDLAPVSPESTALAKELKRYGFRFLGPTTVYAAMESLGVVNDHLRGCHARRACDVERRAASIPRLA